jgi:glycosyltransferase involved in cell wall biosynthesis
MEELYKNQKEIMIIKKVAFILFYTLLPFYFLIIYSSALFVRLFIQNKKRLVFGSTPIINIKYYSSSLKKFGYSTETYTIKYYERINERGDWDRLLHEEFNFAPYYFRPFLAFLFSLFRYDVFFISFDGFFLGNTPLKYFQASILKLANKKIVVIPYGGDSYVYRNIKSVYTIHGLLMSYPMASRNQKNISKNVDYWCKYADCVIPGIMGPDGFGRWDVIMPSTLMIDVEKLWKYSIRENISDGSMETVTVAHAPNHRGFKGTEFIIQAVEELIAEGFKIKLILLENLQNAEVRRILYESTDILIEQLIVTGHGLNAIEGMASGVPVISNLEDDSYVGPLRRWSYFEECPIVSSTPEKIKSNIIKLVKNPSLRKELGVAGRKYVEKYHSYKASIFLFNNILSFIYKEKESLINLYHPILGEFPKEIPKVSHPLVKNQIV